MNKYTIGIVLSGLLLWMIGLITIHSTMPSLSSYHLVYGLMGIFGALVLTRISPQMLLSIPWFWYGLSVSALVITELFGAMSRGSTRWVNIFGFQFQTSEFAKIALLLFSAHYAAKHPIRSYNDFFRYMALMSVPTLLIFAQPDLGSALMVFFPACILVVASGFSFKKIITLMAAGSLMLPIGISFLKPYQMDRIEAFMNPSSDPLGTGYNVRQATIAVGSGMVFGRGLGKGTQSHLKFLPERHTDFVFASYAEEFGFIGAFLMLLMYAVLTWSCLQAARYAHTLAETYLTVMIGMLILIQATINIGMNLGIVPVTGITLPFVSYGGSSLLSLFLCIGMAVSCSSRIKRHYLEIRVS